MKNRSSLGLHINDTEQWQKEGGDKALVTRLLALSILGYGCIMEQKLTHMQIPGLQQWVVFQLWWSTQVSRRVWLSLHQPLLFQKQGRCRTNFLANLPFFSPMYTWAPVCAGTHTHTHLPNYLYKQHLFIERQAGMGTVWDLETERIGFQSCLCPHKGSLWGCSRSLISHLSKKDTLTSFEGILRMKYSNLCSTASSVWHMGHYTPVSGYFSGNADKSHFTSTTRTFLKEHQYSLII